MLDSAIAKKLRNGTGGVIRKADHCSDLSAYCAKVDTCFAGRIRTSYELAALSGRGAIRLRRMPARPALLLNHRRRRRRLRRSLPGRSGIAGGFFRGRRLGRGGGGGGPRTCRGGR